jgi:DNA-directed RNA polymerase subunit M/transcription elongation factor TFIIS
MPPSSSEIPVVILGQKGEIRQGKLKVSSAAGWAACLKKKEVPSVLGKYTWKQKTLFLYGYFEGKANTENQHHLPPPLEGMTFFGDILVVASNSGDSSDKAIPLKTADYETFYTSKLEGEDEEEDEDNELEGSDDDQNAGDDVAEEEPGDEESQNEGDYDDEDESSEEEGEEIDGEEEAPIIVEKPAKAPRTKKIVAHIPDEPEIDPSSTPDSSKFRLHVLKLITSMFADKLTEAEKTVLEGVCFKSAMDLATKEEIRKSWNLQAFRDVYLAVTRRILGNLNPASYVDNKSLWSRFETRELTIEEIAKQNYYELCPEQWQGMVDRQAKREKIQLEGDFSRATDKWQCFGCKKRKCTYYELQTRSADEPMTIFIHCLNCGKRWTQ